jgi:predicted SAM-dependent methyltransferase
LKVNIGCGEFYADGWINVDRTKEDGGPQPDILASAENLPFEDRSVDFLYAGHVLEHVAISNIPAVLDEFSRVLDSDGTLLIVGPDLDKARKSYPEAVYGILHGDCRWEGDEHLWESRESTVENLLEDAGWSTQPVAIEEVDDSFWPLTSKIGWQFAIFANKG